MKKLNLLIIMIFMGVILAGCSSSKLSDVYDEAEVKERAKTVIALLNKEDYENIDKMMSETFKSQVPMDELKKVWQPTLENIGEFEVIKKDTVVGNGDLATAAVMAKYKNGSVTFTITFNEKLELEGLYIK